jgi:hypothetical protein
MLSTFALATGVVGFTCAILILAEYYLSFPVTASGPSKNPPTAPRSRGQQSDCAAPYRNDRALTPISLATVSASANSAC